MLTHIKDAKNHWTVVIGSQSYQFDHTHCEYEGLVECVKVGDEDEFLELLETGTVIENWSEGDFEFRDGFLYYEDEQVASQPTNRILQLIKNGWDHKPMLAYLDRLYQNVSNRAVMESYDWCAHKGLPITPDGCLVGYKGVIDYSGSDTTDKMGRQLQDGDLVDVRLAMTALRGVLLACTSALTSTLATGLVMEERSSLLSSILPTSLAFQLTLTSKRCGSVDILSSGLLVT